MPSDRQREGRSARTGIVSPGARVLARRRGALLAGTGLAGAALALLAAVPATAGTDTWQGSAGASNNWSDGNNWSTFSPPNNGDAVILQQNGPNSPSNFDINLTANSLTLQTSGDAITVANGYQINKVGAVTFQLSNGGSITDNAAHAVADQINTGITLNGAATITLASGATGLTFGTGAITGTGPLTFVNNGTGKLTLSAANTYTGATIVSTGTLTIQNGGALGSTAGTTTVASGATLQLDGDPATVGASITVGEPLSLAGTGDGGNGALRNLTGNNTLTGAITLTADSRIRTEAATQLTVAGQISGAANLEKSGPGTLVLAIANTYTGATTVSAGILNIRNGSALGSTAAGTTVASGATLQLQGGIAVGNEALSLAGAGFNGAGALENVSGNNSWSGPITLTADSTIGVSGGTDTLTLSGQITGAGALTKIGAGTLTLSGNNNYTGATNISAGTLVAASSTALPTQTAVTLNSGATLAIADGVTAQIGSLADGLSGGGLVVIGAVDNSTTLIIGGSASTTFSGSFQGAGSLELDNAASLTLTGASNGGNIGTIGGDLTLCGCESGGLTITGGSLTVNGSHGVAVFGGTLTVANGGTLQVAADFLDGSNTIISGAGSTVSVTGFTGVGIFGPGSLTIASGGVLNSQSGAEIDAFSGTPAATVTGAGSTWNVGAPFGLSVGGGSTGGPGLLTISGGGVVNSTGVVTIGDSAGGTSTVMVTGSGSVLNALNSLAVGDTGCGCNLVGTLIIADGGVVNSPGATSIAAGSTLELGTGGLAGAIITPAIDNAGLIAANFTDTLTLAAAISGAGALTKAGTGTLVLTGTSSYTGATTVNAGTLRVNGAIASSAVTVNSGGTLAGTGTVGPTTINSGGTFAPGNSPGTMTVAGNLVFQSGALFLVQVNPSTSSSANVTAGGSAALAGNVQTLFAPGSYLTKSYDILHASGGLGGTTFAGVSGNVPAGFAESLSYTATDAFLNLTATLGALGTGGLSGNQGNVANALNTFFNNGGTLPPNFVTIFGLTGGNLGNALSQISGEAATGAQQGAFELGGQFLGTMLDPFVDGRSGFGGAAPAMGFAPERSAPERAAMPDEVALAYAAVLKAPPKPAPSFEQRWTAWAAAYGGTNRTGGDPAVVGSHDLSARAGGVAGGFDYHFTRDTVVGFALAGGGTNWGLAQGLGGGNSDAFQAGVYGATRWGPAYLAAAFGFTNHWMSTDRTAFAGDHLTARFNAQSLGGRVEGGYRLANLYGGFAPYAALQAQSFRTPSYTETDVSGGGFALSNNARTATDTRSELGARFDHRLPTTPGAALTLRARLAWAHDWVSDPTLAAVFQTLPGASFIVNGATPAKDSALASAGAELALANGVTLLARFDGEFANRSQTYAGTGTLRYSW